MKKNITIIALLILTVCAFFYAYVKSNEANVLVRSLRETQELASYNEAVAKEQEMKALDAAAEAKRQQAMTEDYKAQLENCLSK